MTGLLKFITCGSVDDGKSTLIGHMLYDTKLIFADQENTLILDSKIGNRHGGIDYSLLLDGLIAEREQGITIDVAYRYFCTEKRSFIVADTPGHDEYTRNMAVGASFADLAVILVDATKGIVHQTRRHIRICALMGIKHFLFAANKMDLAEYDEGIFRDIKKDISNFISEFSYKSCGIIPVSATVGDNVVVHSENMPWYEGKTLLAYLEDIDISEAVSDNAFVMPVQRVSRPEDMPRGYQGQVVQGTVAVGDELTILPSCEKAHVRILYAAGKDVERIMPGQAVTVTLDRDADISRGYVFADETTLSVSRLFRADMLWMDDAELVPGREYLLKLGSKTVAATILNINYRIDTVTGRMAAKVIRKNDILSCDISLSEKIVLCSFDTCRELGRFILINRMTNMTSACGVISYPMRRSDNLTWQNIEISRDMRAAQKNQCPFTLWLTGLSGAGKSTLANAIEKELVSQGRHTMILDGDNVRMGLNHDLGFTESDRVENIRRLAEVSKLMNDAGLIVLVAAISPYEADREKARKIIGNSYIELYVSTPIEECEKRDVKGLYNKARNGVIPNFTGVNSPYEIPRHPDIVVDTSLLSLNDSVDFVLEHLKKIIPESVI